MNCAERLVEIFGSQAEVARAFRLDRAVVSHWVKMGYVPARWAVEVERLSDGQIAATEVLNEANAKKPVRVKSRPDAEGSLGDNYGSDHMTNFAPAKRISSFHPPQRTLMGPGPTEIHPRVLTTMSQPAIGYLDPIFVDMMEELKSLLRYTYQTKNPLTFPVSGPGSVGMEFCFVNLIEPGDEVVIIGGQGDDRIDARRHCVPPNPVPPISRTGERALSRGPGGFISTRELLDEPVAGAIQKRCEEAMIISSAKKRMSGTSRASTSSTTAAIGLLRSRPRVLGMMQKAQTSLHPS